MDQGYAIGTNEVYHVYEGAIEDEKLMTIDLAEHFPEIPEGIDIVFDLAGTISKISHSITSALLQSDVIIVPIINEVKSLNCAIGTLREIDNLQGCNATILVVATKLRKRK